MSLLEILNGGLVCFIGVDSSTEVKFTVNGKNTFKKFVARVSGVQKGRERERKKREAREDPFFLQRSFSGDHFDFPALLRAATQAREFVKVIPNLRGCPSEKISYARCLQGNPHKLYIKRKVIKCRIR